MYKIIVSSASRYAEFTVDAKKDQVSKDICKKLNDYECEEGFGCEAILLSVFDNYSGESVEEQWSYFAGTKDQIVELITECIGLSFSEYKVIFPYLGAIESGDEKLHLLYPNAKPPREKIEWTREYSILRKYAKLLIEDVYGIPKGVSTVLAINS